MAGTGASLWKPGQSGNPAGRPRGSGKPRIDEALKQYGLDPIKKIAELLPSLEPHIQAKLMMDLVPYIYPRPKEILVDDDGLENLSTAELVAVVKAKLPFLEKDLPTDKTAA